MAPALVDRVLSRFPRYAGSGSRNGRAYFHSNPATTFISSVEVQITAMQGEMSQPALDPSAVLDFLRNQMYFYRQRNPVSLSVPAAVATPGDSAYVQSEVVPATGQTMGRSATHLQPQHIDYPRVTAKLLEALDKQIAKREKRQSIVSYAMDFLNARSVFTTTPSWLWNRAFWRSSSQWIGHQAALTSIRRRFTLSSTTCTTTPTGIR
eukprot:4071372-Pleurochrysis_carterae.AAC.1